MIFLIALMDICLLIDSKILTKNVKKENKQRIKVGTLILITLITSIIMLIIACIISLMPGAVYDAIVA